jgi:phage baseplate assembly protein W
VIKEEIIDHNTGPSDEDLMAIANAVREVANTDIGNKSMQPELGRRGHLRVLPSN